MIMAGRGRRLENTNEDPKVGGIPANSPEIKTVDLPFILNKITEIDTKKVNLSHLLNIQSSFKQLLTSKEIMRDVLSTLHNKALEDAEFGEKTVLALELISHLEVEDSLVRGEILSFVQNDFKSKDTMAQTNKKTFFNSVSLLGNIYNRFKVCGAPIVVLGIALLEYLDLLIKGEEEDFKVLAKQVFINGKLLSHIKNYESLVRNLRTTLMTTQLNESARCWLLLVIDFMSNDLKPLKGIVRDFYIEKLGNEFTKLESLIPFDIEEVKPSPNSPNSSKSPDSSSVGNKNFRYTPNKTDGFKRDLNKKFSDLSVKPSSNKDRTQSLPGKNKKDIWKSGGDRKSSGHGHDDRFDKDENFYGAQKPRQPKPFNQKKKFNDAKLCNKDYDDFKEDIKTEKEEVGESNSEN